MPTIKELIRKAKVRNLHKKDQESTYRCAPKGAMSPFQHGAPIVKQNLNKPMTQAIVEEIHKAGY
jgi:hypothetical protein|tara:strand:- start:1894 stop:2088 length:195 start_codon:yes stop_codon:yes gene_type:complete